MNVKKMSWSGRRGGAEHRPGFHSQGKAIPIGTGEQMDHVSVFAGQIPSWVVTLGGEVCLLGSCVSWGEANLKVMLSFPRWALNADLGLAVALITVTTTLQGEEKKIRTNFENTANRRNERWFVNAWLAFSCSFLGTCAACSVDATLGFAGCWERSWANMSPCTDWSARLYLGPSLGNRGCWKRVKSKWIKEGLSYQRPLKTVIQQTYFRCLS